MFKCNYYGIIIFFSSDIDHDDDDENNDNINQVFNVDWDFRIDDEGNDVVVVNENQNSGMQFSLMFESK